MSGISQGLVLCITSFELRPLQKLVNTIVGDPVRQDNDKIIDDMNIGKFCPLSSVYV